MNDIEWNYFILALPGSRPALKTVNLSDDFAKQLLGLLMSHADVIGPKVPTPATHHKPQARPFGRQDNEKS